MAALQIGDSIVFEAIYAFNSDFFDPIFDVNADSPNDVKAYIIRGKGRGGPVVDGPYSFLNQGSTVNQSAYIYRAGEADYIFKYTIPLNLIGGIYTAVIETSIGKRSVVREYFFQVASSEELFSASLPQGSRNAVINIAPQYKPLSPFETNTIALIGHADQLGINHIQRISSVQDAVNLLGANTYSPLLRGVFDAYAAGAKDVYIVPTAPMNEYIESRSERNVAQPFLDGSTFYEKYYERLQVSYNILKDYDFIDLIVPLEASFFDTGSVNFVDQLTTHCNSVFEDTGFIQIGILGARSNGVNSTDIELIEGTDLSYPVVLDAGGYVIEDPGKFVVLIYGEAVFNHPQLQQSWTAPVSAALAGQISNHPIGFGLNRSKLLGSYTVYGGNLTQAELNILHSKKVNTIIRNNRSRRGAPYEIFISNDLTLARDGSAFANLPQVRLVSLVTNEIKKLTQSYIGRFAQQEAIDVVGEYLELLKSTTPPVIIDYEYTAKVDTLEKGKLVFDITLVSARGLKRIDFSIETGPGA